MVEYIKIIFVRIIMRKIAILGFGTVGGGVFDAININSKQIKSRLGDDGGIEIAHILDRRTFDGHPLADRVTSDIDKVISDPETEVVVEAMGGLHPAYEFTLKALRAGKSVVTSNKECVERYGEELEAEARKNNASYLYEASAGGGIPCVHTLRNCLAWGDIRRVAGILNGTTNFILTKMAESKLPFDEALAMAQRLGFAEADPTADICGHDAARKICILGGIAWDRFISYDQISHVEGITEVSCDDLAAADALGYAVKLIAMAERRDDGIVLSVSPMLVHKEHIFASVGGSYNAVSILGETADEVVLYGRGAGSLPTANAVLSDVIEALTVHPIPASRNGNITVLTETPDNSDTITLATGKKMSVFG